MRNPLVALALALASIAGCPSQLGCAGNKTVNSTKMMDYITRGEQVQSRSALPGDALDDPALAGKVIILPNIPGKNVSFKWNYPDGTPKMELVTSRSAVLDAIFAGAMGVDAQKFAEDAAQREFFAAQLDKALGMVQPFIAQALQERVARASEPDKGNPTREQLDALLLQTLTDISKRLAQQGNPPIVVPPPSAPVNSGG